MNATAGGQEAGETIDRSKIVSFDLKRKYIAILIANSEISKDLSSTRKAKLESQGSVDGRS